MKKHFLFVSLLVTFFGFSQNDKKYGIELNYPLILDTGATTQLGSLGLANVNLHYTFNRKKSISKSVVYAADYWILNEKSAPYNERNFVHSLSYFSEFTIQDLSFFKPYLGAGYSLRQYSSTLNNSFFQLNNLSFNPTVSGLTQSINELHHGFNLNFGTKLFVSKSFYFNLSHTLHRFNMKKSAFTGQHWKNYSIVKSGIGIIF